MRNANEHANDHDEMLDELARMNPVHDDDLVGLVPDPGHDSLPSLIMLEDQVVDGRVSAGHSGRRWVGGVLQGALVARGVFVGAVACICLLAVGVNLLLSDQVRGSDRDGFDAAASTLVDDSAGADDGASTSEASAAPGLPMGSETPTTRNASESGDVTELSMASTGDVVSTGPEVSIGSDVSAAAEPSTAEESSTTAGGEPAGATETTQPPTSTPASTPTPTSTPAEPCTAEGPTLPKAVAAYRSTCTEPRADCDPIAGSKAWLCSSEIIGIEGPSATWG